jgi:hypothetical protein
LSFFLDGPWILCVFGSTSGAFLPWMMFMVDYRSPGFVNNVAHLQSNGGFFLAALPVVLLGDGNRLGNEKVSLIPDISVHPRDEQQHASIFLA